MARVLETLRAWHIGTEKYLSNSGYYLYSYIGAGHILSSRNEFWGLERQLCG